MNIRYEENKINQTLNQHRITRLLPSSNNPHKTPLNNRYALLIKNAGNVRIFNIYPNRLGETADLKIQ